MVLDKNALSRKVLSNQSTTSGRVLILLENEKQVKDCISWIDEIKGEKQIIALTPFAMYELDKHDLNYKIPEDYYCREELYQMGIDNFNKVENLCNLIDADIQLDNNYFSELNIKPAMFSFCNLKIMYDTITIRVFQLSKIFGREEPSIVFFYDSTKYPFGNVRSAPYLIFNRRESLYSQLFSLNGWGVSQKKLPYIKDTEELSNVQNESLSKNLKEKAKQYLSNHPELYDIALTTKKRGLQGFLQWFINYLYVKKDFQIILYGAGYNWDDCNEDLRLEGIAPVYRITDDFHWLDEAIAQSSDSMQVLWSDLQEKPEFRSFFVMNNIDFYPLVEERLEFLVKRMSLACLLATKYVIDYIAKKNIKAVIAATLPTCVAHSVAQAAHNSKIPVITWQHGGYGATETHSIVNYLDLINSDAHFVFGNGVIDSYYQAAKKYGTELIAIGSSSLECLEDIEMISREDDQLNNGKEILYVTSAYQQNESGISTFPPFSDILFWQTQKSIIDILGQHNNHTITVKLHPSDSYDVPPLHSYSLDCGYDHINFIQNEKSFTELLQKANAVIIDLPFTTILQALTTRKPIFAYTGLVYYNANAQKLLSKRAICSRNLDEFLFLLDKYLSENIYEANLSNTEFLEMYGITSNKGTSQKRAPQELKKLLISYTH